MSRPVVLRARAIYDTVWSAWPKQELRPDYQLQDVLRKAAETRLTGATPAAEAIEVDKARALQFLAKNKFQEAYKLQGSLLKPKSNPAYFGDLIREIEEAPKRTWFQRIGKRLSGLIRLR